MCMDTQVLTHPTHTQLSLNHPSGTQTSGYKGLGKRKPIVHVGCKSWSSTVWTVNLGFPGT